MSEISGCTNCGVVSDLCGGFLCVLIVVYLLISRILIG